jgi:hypothetical protein
MGEAIPVGSLRPIRTARETLGGCPLERPSCGGFMPTAETTLIPAYKTDGCAYQPRSLTSSARLDNEPNYRRWAAMTSFRQIDANRRNARKSTGPTTEEGKQRSRYNAVRHGLTAETVIGALEDAEDYRAFEAAITADYDAQSAVERELIVRLAGLLWRLHRATIIETGLFEIQADHLTEVRRHSQLKPASREVVYALFRRANAVDVNREPATDGTASALLGSAPDSIEPDVHHNVELARCYLRLANLPNFALDRLSRYEATLWRQVRQTLLALDALDRRKPQERGRRRDDY